MTKKHSGKKPMDEKPENLFIIEVHCKGLQVGVTKSPEDRIITTFFRFSKEEKSKFQYFKIRTYRLLERLSNFKLGDKYVISTKNLLVFEKEFQQIYIEFAQFRKEVYDRLNDNWPLIFEKMSTYAKRFEIPTEKLERLKPNDELFLDLNYDITPLPSLLRQIYKTYEDFQQLSRQKEEYRMLAERMRRKMEETRMELKKQYDEKIRTLNEKIEMLKIYLKEEKKKRYVEMLKHDTEEISSKAMEIAELLGPETAEELNEKLDMLKQMLLES